MLTQNRKTFLEALRSGQYTKGPIGNDERGRPVPGATGYCVVGLAHDLFNDGSNLGSPLPMRQALGLKPKDFTKMQQEWNDSELTFAEIADLIELEMFHA